ncbi:OpgC domain-containing protein [Frigidibacter sp. SD6-1]|uniref:OpgC family protein n=1 Tax=Frigidibacter sp. SD6-1 TaxID=3032581 RepID=UPI0024DF9EE7|nr:OpgC domain-containing protein [Frigidibacter sp. SD6-1]
MADALARIEPGDAAPAEDRIVRLAPKPQVKKPRDRRLDVFRGLCLVMIFINHVPGTMFEGLTSRNFGFSDAAEAFVFISGCSAALAYASGFDGAARLWPGISRMWGRAWTLYLVHLLVTFWAIAIAAAAWRFGGDSTLFFKDNIQVFARDPLGVLVGLPLMSHQLGYVNILPMYAVLLLTGPAMIMAGLRAPWATFAGALGVWALCGFFYVDLPNFPNRGGWFLNPLSWQLLFVAGLMTGLALRRGERFVPRHPVLIGLAVAVLLGAILWMKLPGGGAVGAKIVRFLLDLGLPRSLADFDKTYLSLPRLLHAFALVYLLGALGWVRSLCNSRWLEPLALMGRIALPVFAFGTILSFAARAVKEVSPESLWLDAGLIAGGIIAMWALAFTLQTARAAAKAGQVRPA